MNESNPLKVETAIRKACAARSFWKRADNLFTAMNSERANLDFAFSRDTVARARHLAAELGTVRQNAAETAATVIVQEYGNEPARLLESFRHIV